MKKLLCYIAVLCIFLGVCGCQSKPVEVFREAEQTSLIYADVAQLSFEEAIAASTDVVKGRFVKYHKHETYTELEFQVTETLKGNTVGENIFVFELPQNVTVIGTEKIEYVSGQYNYVPGNMYLLILEKSVSVYNEHDRYMLLGDIFVPLSDDIGCYMYNRPLGITGERAVASATENCQTRSGSVSYYGKEPVAAETIKELAEASDYVMHISVDKIDAEGKYNNTVTCTCSVKEVKKGTFTKVEQEEWGNEEWGNEIYVVFKPEDVEVGKEYLGFLTRADMNSRIFIYSAQNSIYPVTQEMEMEKLCAEAGF